MTRDLPLLRPGRVWECHVSPDGDRIAWVAQRLGDDGEEEELYDLWVSDLDGSVTADLGRVPGSWARSPGDPDGEHYCWPQELAWVPGGARLSFVYRDALWTVPVDAA